MPELNTAANDATIAGTEKLLTLAFEYITVAQLRTYLGTVDIITEASAFTADPATHSGSHRLILAADDVTFDSAETYSAGEAYNIRATAALALVETGATLTPPAGGTLNLDADMAVTVVFTGATTAIVIGQTAP